MPHYLHQDSNLTLREGFEEYRRPALLRAFVPGSSGERMLEAHDVAHVIFGCATDLRGEVLVHAWTVFGPALTLAGAHQATREAEHRHVLRTLGWKAVPELALALPLAARVAARARRMPRTWPFHGFEPYLERPLGELRQRFGIRVIA